jgi:hypothetical protein
MPPDLRAARARELYEHLPEVYRSRDWEGAVSRAGEQAVRSGAAVPELEAFLGIVADEILRLRGQIGDLWDDFFIETCAEWVVPYLADVLGTRLVFNAAQRNRVDVNNTVDWRRRKGTLRMLADLAAGVTGWSAATAEFFENLAWTQHLDHRKLDHTQAPDLRDPYRLSLLGTAADPWLHAVDVRRPQGSRGRYAIKTVGFYLSRLTAYPLRGVIPDAVGATGECFTFDPLGRDLPLFDRRDRQPVTAPAFAHDPWNYFGDPAGFGVLQHGVLLAAGRAATPAPAEPGAAWTGFGGLSAGDKRKLGTAGLELMEPEGFEHPMRRFVITALWGETFASAVALGTLATYGQVLVPGSGKAAAPGSLLLSVELAAGAPMALFPTAVLAIRNDRAVPRVADARAHRYQDALYVYLPEVLLGPGDVLRLCVGEDGSTFYARRDAPHIGAANVKAADIFGVQLDRTLLARAALGQCYPTRALPFSLQPSDLADLHHVSGLRLPDEATLAGSGFSIDALLYRPPPQSPILLGSLVTKAVGPQAAFEYAHQASVTVAEGDRLLLRVTAMTTSDTLFPMTDLVVTDRRGRGLLVALPEMEFTTFPTPVWLYFDTDGATYYAATNYGHDTALAAPQRDQAFRFDPQTPASGLARRSAGQVLSIPGTAPLRQRLPIYASLCYWDHPKPRPPRRGQLAVDPVRGRFRFAPNEQPVPPAAGAELGIRVDYHEGFTWDVGALPYDRYASLKTPDNPAPTRFVASSGDADHGTGPVHATLADAVNAAQDGDVIQIEDSATYEHTTVLDLSSPGKVLVIQAANYQRPCLRFAGGGQLVVAGSMDLLRLNGLLASGATLEITDAGQVKTIELIACSLDPAASATAVTARAKPQSQPVCQLTLCRSVVGALRLGRGVAELIVADSIVDGATGIALGDLAGAQVGALVHLERVTMWGSAAMRRLFGSECLLVGDVQVGDRQDGCLRYSRYEVGSRLPRRFQCVPQSDTVGDPVNPAFNSRRFGRPGYGQLHLVCPASIRGGTEDGAEMGAFHGGLATLRAGNLDAKLDEYLPVGLTPALIYVT